MPIWFVQKKGFVRAIFLNLGAGASDHPFIMQTTSQEKIPFRYFAFDIPDDIFRGGMGQAAFLHSDAIHSSDPGFEKDSSKAEKIYDIFRLVGTLRTDFGVDPVRLARLGQRAMNCSEMAVLNVVLNELIEEDLSPNDVERFLCNTNFLAIIQALMTVRKKPKQPIVNSCTMGPRNWI